jgi:transcriptional/translational regulatory protein YebC/TACO1
MPAEGDQAQKIARLVEALEDNDDVQSVSHNAELPASAGV